MSRWKILFEMPDMKVLFYLMHFIVFLTELPWQADTLLNIYP